jgi:hypothetical protein
MSGDDRSGPLARLRAWLASLFGGTADETAGRAPEAGAAADDPPATHVCTVCGTDVVDPEGGCPLCGSTDVRERDAPAGDDEGPSAAATATESTVDDEAARLRDLRGAGEATDGEAGGAASTDAEDASAE